MITFLVLMVPLAYTLVNILFICLFLLAVTNRIIQGVRYHIPNEALVGACFIPSGIGNICS